MIERKDWPEDAQQTMTRSCRQNIVVDEYDDHTKNFSLMLKKSGEWQRMAAKRETV